MGMERTRYWLYKPCRRGCEFVSCAKNQGGELK